MIVNTLNGNLQVHIRQYTRYGKRLYPTKIGINLTPSRFMVLLYSIDAIKLNVEKLRNGETDVYLKVHLGGGIFARVSSNFHTVDIRRFFLPEGTSAPWPTRKGIALRLSEWDALVAHLDDISKLIDAKPCFEDHPDLSTRLRCEECSPFQPFLIQN